MVADAISTACCAWNANATPVMLCVNTLCFVLFWCGDLCLWICFWTILFNFLCGDIDWHRFFSLTLSLMLPDVLLYFQSIAWILFYFMFLKIVGNMWNLFLNYKTCLGERPIQYLNWEERPSYCLTEIWLIYLPSCKYLLASLHCANQAVKNLIVNSFKPAPLKDSLELIHILLWRGLKET